MTAPFAEVDGGYLMRTPPEGAKLSLTRQVVRVDAHRIEEGVL